MPRWLNTLARLLHLSEDVDFLATVLGWVGLRPRDIFIAGASGAGATLWSWLAGASILDRVLYGLAALAIILGLIAVVRFLMGLHVPSPPQAGIPSTSRAPVEERPAPDVDARVAFFEVLANSDWSRQQRPGTKQPLSDWLARQLDREIHNQLRQERLKAWGCRCLTATVEAPESEIPGEEWQDIEIDFTPLDPNFPRTSAMWRIRRGGFNTVFAGVRFCKNQIYSNFPLIATDTTPTPAGIQPDWPIQELFYHIKPDLLENADEAAWETIGGDLRDAFALNLIKVWGRPIGDGIGRMLGERPVLRLIDSGYWHSAHFTYAFFDDTAGDAPHTYAERNSDLPEYTDLRVNRAETLTAWRHTASRPKIRR
jgi:hypothetical protein